MTDFREWEKDRLVNYLEFLMHSYRVVDALWFINIERDHGLDEACRINELVWGKVGELAARDLKERFEIHDGGLDGFVQAIELYPWSIITGYQIDPGPDHVLISVPSCLPQEARLKRGLGEYPCGAMHMAEFISFAAKIDPKIKVSCLFAPPDPHPSDLFCQWRFTIS